MTTKSTSSLALRKERSKELESTRATGTSDTAAGPTPRGDGEGRQRAVIEAVTPEVDGGRHAIKRVVGEKVVIEADIFADGHEVLSAVLLFRQAGETEWNEAPLLPVVNDRWRASLKSLVSETPFTVSKRGWTISNRGGRTLKKN